MRDGYNQSSYKEKTTDLKGALNQFQGGAKCPSYYRRESKERMSNAQIERECYNCMYSEQNRKKYGLAGRDERCSRCTALKEQWKQAETTEHFSRRDTHGTHQIEVRR